MLPVATAEPEETTFTAALPRVELSDATAAIVILGED